MRKPARTIHLLHFEDLELNRFEDLCRQLIYDARDWSSIEAIGRTGANEGIDIRAMESIPVTDDTIEENKSDYTPQRPSDQRAWIV
jgi:hypothetical protein